MSRHLTEVKAGLLERLGIEFPRYRDPLLERVLMDLGGGELAIGAQRFLDEDPDAARRLVQVVTIGETYLFRHHGHFAQLRQLAEKRRAQGRGISVLSAGCSTGEEVWCAAAVIRSVYGEALDACRVVGLDVDESRLAIARAAEIPAHRARIGLHGYDAQFERDGNVIRPHPGLRPMVRFVAQNLAAEGVEGRWDAVFFRNVAIYWDRERIGRFLDALYAVTAADGVVLYGPADPLDRDSRWTRIHGEEVSHLAKTEAVVVPTPLPEAPGRIRRRPRKKPERRRTLTSVPHLPGPPPSQPVAASPERTDVRDAVSARVAEARVYANAGRIDAARTILEALPEPRTPEAVELAGVLLVEAGDFDGAVEHFRRQVYFHPDDEVARQWLVTSLELAGRPRAAERARRAGNGGTP